MRAANTYVQMSKRTTKTNGDGTHIQVRYNTTAHLDGNWHHIVGVATPEGMTVYLDGATTFATNLASANPLAGTDVRYDRTDDFFVGRHGGNGGNYDFHGEIDDVRVYNHVMTPSDVAWLFAGKP
jgi:hypothetical protein